MCITMTKATRWAAVASFVACVFQSPNELGADAAPAHEEITNLPGFGVPPTKQYSGYLNAKGGCDPSEDVCRLHYWFAAAEKPTEKTPVILWLNGGPGSSAVIGMVEENGPLLIDKQGGLMENPYSWTKVGHFLIIEQPIGVGYSYCSTQINGGVCKNTDKLTASATRAALVDFFTNKFPEFAKKDFFITGESYAGVYIPTIAKEILDHAKDVVPLKGLAVGDPCTDTVAQADAFDGIWYGHKYGFVPDQEFDFLRNTCGAVHPSLQSLGGWHMHRHKSTQELQALQEKVAPGPKFNRTDPACQAAYRKFLVSTSNAFSQGWSRMWINDYSLYSPAGLTAQDDAMTAYMMRDDVKKALHVEDFPGKEWPMPKQGFSYESQYDACNPDAVKGTPSMIDFYREIAPQLEIVIVYNGDSDPCVSYEGTRTAVTRVGFAELDGGGYRPWFYNHAAASLNVINTKAALFGPDLNRVATGAQFGGEVVDYEHGLHFATFHGSGHMVPEFRPQAAFHFVSKLVARAPLSPPLPLNATIAAYTNDEFDVALNKWTDEAKGFAFIAEVDDVQGGLAGGAIIL